MPITIPVVSASGAKSTVTVADPVVQAPGAIQWAPAPHNDWTSNSYVVLNGKAYFPESAETPHSLQISTNTSSPIVRCEVRNGELWPAFMDGIWVGGNDTERAELDGALTLYPKGQEFWLSYQFLIEPGQPQIATAGGFPGGPLAWGVIGQIHSSSDGAPGVPWSLSIVNNVFRVITQSGNGTEKVHYTSPYQIERDRIYRVVIRIKITGNASSILMAWIDGVQVVNSTSNVIGGTSASAYVKVGIYRGWQFDGYPPLAVRLANVEHGTSSLQSRVLSPLAWPVVPLN